MLPDRSNEKNKNELQVFPGIRNLCLPEGNFHDLFLHKDHITKVNVNLQHLCLIDYASFLSVTSVSE